MSQANLKNKVVVITGGSGVLGVSFSKRMAARGAKVVILCRDLVKGDAVTKEIQASGGQAMCLAADVLERASLEAAHKQVLEVFGPCDILINGAGGNHPDGTTSKEYFAAEDLHDATLKTFFDLKEMGVESVFHLNYMGTLLPTQVFAKDMIGRAGCSIINISSMNADTPLTKIPAYSGAKAAISNFTKWLAVHMSKVGIRVNAIAPGFFLTTQNEKMLIAEDGQLTDRAEKIISHTPLERFGEPEELLGTLEFLANEEASGFITGIVIPVDGGFSAYSGV
ncbi:SDR family oxidoreductase [Listeria grandensis]|uniref:SDR family oxidoreductase n=1 Tax=Listeria grandensis TaxID=1494963 RepID=UPI00164D8276|nr:SDR family oxidoreductase [Listeria grandensis]MBC6314187.1 SDR family oxidoreductase [Listeria grandensis]